MGGDLAEFVLKKRNTDHDFPPPLYVGGKKQYVINQYYES